MSRGRTWTGQEIVSHLMGLSISSMRRDQSLAKTSSSASVTTEGGQLCKVFLPDPIGVLDGYGSGVPTPCKVGTHCVDDLHIMIRPQRRYMTQQKASIGWQ
jgi:hypothetical protein